MTPPFSAAGRLVVGFHGFEPDAAFATLLRETGAGGVILFARNIRDADQARDLIATIRGLVDRPLLIAVDQEGGAVVRVTEGATVFPGNMALGAAADPVLAREQGRISGEELAAMGFDLNLAPVVDLQTNPANPGIGIRSFGADPRAAGVLAREYVLGHAEAGVACCLKHFPGMGAAEVDPHLDLPVLPQDLDEFRDPHLRVFEDVLEDLAGRPCAIMSTHILVRGLDPDLPATLSARVIRDVLRDRMGFTGPVITDCLEMGAIVKRWGVPAAALAATRAGHDLVLVCHTPERQRGAAARLEQALREGELDADENAAALARIATLRRDAKRAPLTADPARGAAVAATIAARALTRFGDAGGLLALDPEAPLRLVSVRPRSVVGAEEESNRDWGAWLRARAARVGFTRLAIEEIEPDDAVGARAVTERALAGGERILLFGWDARGHEGSRTLMLELARRAPDRLVVVHLRNPFDQALLGPGVTAVTAQGYTTAQIDALFAALAGRADWPGTMPAPLR